MSKFESPLENISIASPCSADWEQMYGDDRKRYCGDCKLNVYNLSGMTKADAEQLVARSEGRLCVRYYQRLDGSIITDDCPVGWAKLRQRTRLYATAAASLVMALLTGVFFVSLFSNKPSVTMGELVAPKMSPTPKLPPKRPPVMGVVAPPRPTPSPKDKKQQIDPEVVRPLIDNESEAG